MTQFSQGFRLYLPDAFTRNFKLLADFLDRVVSVHADAEAHLHYFGLAGLLKLIPKLAAAIDLLSSGF